MPASLFTRAERATSLRRHGRDGRTRHRHRGKRRVVAVLGTLLASAALGQAPSISVRPASCLPTEDNALLTAAVRPEVGGSSVRLYFRRLHPEGDLYYVEMKPAGGGEYWTTFPQPEDQQQTLLDDSWWSVLKSRDWMRADRRDWLEDRLGERGAGDEDCAVDDGRECLERWLELQENEAAEYFVAVYDPHETLLAASEWRLVEVREDCPVRLTALERGWAANLTVGETTEDQRGDGRKGKELFHWLCNGITARIGADGIPRPDEHCRRCVIGRVPLLEDHLLDRCVMADLRSRPGARGRAEPLSRLSTRFPGPLDVDWVG